MLYREIIAVCSQIHTEHINTLCGQNVELLNVKLVVYIVTTGLYSHTIGPRASKRLIKHPSWPGFPFRPHLRHPTGLK